MRASSAFFFRPAVFLYLSVFLTLSGASAQEASDPGADLQLVEAVRMMLEHDPNLTIGEAQLRSSRGSLLSARGSFDPVLSTRVTESETSTPLDEALSRERSVLGNTVGVSKRFRSGLAVQPEVGLLRTQDDGPAANVGTVSFEIRQPLLRGRGRAANAAPELSAEREVAASVLDLRQTTALRAFTIVTQYWETRAAVLNLEILRAAEQSARELLETTRRLIEADVQPAAEVVQVEANLVSQETSRIGGERLLFQSRQDLGREIGLDPARIAELPLPSDPFPVVRSADVPAAAEEGRFVSSALERRSDLLAARERRQGVEVLVRAAGNALKPQLDLVFTPSYSGLVEGTEASSFFSPLFRNVPGASSSLSLILSWPTLNSRARGDLAQIEASREQAMLLEDLVVRQIGADVPTALDAVRRGAQQLERAAEAVRLFEQAVVNEEKKLRAGSSTLIDVITQRDRLTSARQQQVSAHLALAVALARLRYETGTLPQTEEEAAATGYAQLTTIPFPAGGEGP
jgi:outer membrane protein TolC